MLRPHFRLPIPYTLAMPRKRPKWHKARRCWYVFFEGKQRYLGTDEAGAWTRLDKLLYDSGVPVRPLTLAGAADEWLKAYPSRDNEWRLARWTRSVGHERLRDMSIDHLDRFAAYLRRAKMKPGHGHKTKPKAGYSPKTIRDTVQTVRRVLQWCHDHDWIARVPRLPKLAKSVKMPKDLSPKTLDDVWQTLGKARRILTFILETGCRPSEACGLDWDEVDLAHHVCVLGKHKTDRYGSLRTLALTDSAKEILEAISYRTGPVFRSRLGRPYTPAGLRSILRRRGISGAYALRHTRAQSMVDDEIPLDVVAAWLGHQSQDTVSRYAQVRAQRLVKVARKLKPLIG